jgi:hypothetical protein
MLQSAYHQQYWSTSMRIDLPTVCLTIACTLAATGERVNGQGMPRVAPPIRKLGVVTSSLDSVFKSVSIVRTLSTGQLLVLDLRGQQLVLVEPELRRWRAISDTSGKAVTRFFGVGGMIPYKGDTTLFVDTRHMALVLISPQGQFGRTLAVPRPNDAPSLAGGAAGFPGFDLSGRLVFRGRPAPPTKPRVGSDGMAEVPPLPELYPLLRFDMQTREVDTVTQLKVPASQMAFYRSPAGVATLVVAYNPLPVADDWALLPDGTVAVIRVIDYHVDFIRADGGRVSGPRIPFDWQHLDDAMKIAFVDSAKAAMQALSPTREFRIADSRERAPAAMFGIAPTSAQQSSVPSGEASSSSAAGIPAGGNGAAATTVEWTPPPSFLVSPDRIPDYAPPFAPGSTRVDLEGNLWIKTSVAVGGSPLYHVVDRNGRLVDRILVPQGCVVAGFGPHGVVYLGVRDGVGTRLERAQLSPRL